MPDREKVINGLEHCMEGVVGCQKICPYKRDFACRSELARDALALLREQEPVATDTNVLGKWINVKNDLPKEETEYICWFGDYPLGAFARVCRWNKIKGAFWCYSDNAKWAFVTHWMPLPKPPKDESAPARILTLDELRALPVGSVVWEEYRQDDGEMGHLAPTVKSRGDLLTNWHEQEIEIDDELLRHDEAGFQVRYWSAEPDKQQMEGADWDA